MAALPPEPLSDEALFKRALMETIDGAMRRRFRTVAAAAEQANVAEARLWRLRSRRHEQFSVTWLFRLATAAGVRIRINIELAN